MNKKNGFTLIELMVAITVSMIMMTGLGLSINNYYNVEKINQTNGDLVSLISLARNLAVTNQRPAGFTEDLGRVVVNVNSNGLVEAFAYGNVSGIGGSYFSKDIADNRVSTTISGDLRFVAGTGKLVDNFGNLLPSSTEIGIVIASEDVGETRQVIITSLGTIK
jgi:prepilin-type N-terminal cleavage/methylation domain-containing protein